MRFASLFVLSLSFCSCMGAAPFNLSDLAKIVNVSDPQVSPDGKSIVFVVSRPDYDLNVYRSELVLIDIATRHQRTLTHDRKGVNSPRWSPSGDRLGFMANDSNNRQQLFVMPMTGGDSEQLTTAGSGIQQYAWRPDGEAIAFAASDEAPIKTGQERFDDAFEVGNNDFLVTAKPLPMHLWLVSLNGPKATRLTSGNWSLPISHPPFAPPSPISWSPDGKSIVFTKVATAYSGDANQSTIQQLNVESGQYQPITGHAKYEGYPAFSPDGSHIAYQYPRDGQIKNGAEIYVTSRRLGEGADITRPIDRDFVRALWMPDGKSLLVGANDGTTVALWVQPLDGKPLRLKMGDICPSWAFWIDMSVGPGSGIAFTGTEPHRPAELYYLPDPTAKPQRLTDFNAWSESLEFGKTETVEWDSPDGHHEDGVLTFPPDFSSNWKYPLVLWIHGGPPAASHETFSPMTDLIAAQGWVVFEPNYRGSDNLGNKYQAAISDDAGEGPGRDVMAGIGAVKKRGFVDQSNVAVTGWSYGGFMTTWLLSHFNGWKTAITGAAITDWVEYYDLSDFNVRIADGFAAGPPGSPYVENRMKAYVEQSPSTYFQKITTPTLILADTGDHRVPISQSYRLYHALKDRGVPTQFFAYPVPGHVPNDPIRGRDILRRWVAWLSQYLDKNPGLTQ